MSTRGTFFPVKAFLPETAATRNVSARKSFMILRGTTQGDCVSCHVKILMCEAVSRQEGRNTQDKGATEKGTRRMLQGVSHLAFKRPHKVSFFDRHIILSDRSVQKFCRIYGKMRSHRCTQDALPMSGSRRLIRFCFLTINTSITNSIISTVATMQMESNSGGHRPRMLTFLLPNRNSENCVQALCV